MSKRKRKSINKEKFEETWGNIPDEIVVNIFSYLSLQQILSLAQVCRRFKRLTRDYCLINTLIEEWADIPNGAFKRFISSKPPLKTVIFRGCDVTDTSIMSISRYCFSTLQKIELSHCKYITSKSIKSIAKYCTSLQSLSLNLSPYVGDIITMLADTKICYNLVSLTLEIGYEIPQTNLEKIEKFTSLTNFSLNWESAISRMICKENVEMVPHLTNLKKLASLAFVFTTTLKLNNFYDFENLTSLSLYLQKDNFDFNIFSTKLEILTLENCNLNDLANCTKIYSNLKSLFVSTKKIDLELIPFLSKIFPNLIRLSIKNFDRRNEVDTLSSQFMQNIITHLKKLVTWEILYFYPLHKVIYSRSATPPLIISHIYFPKLNENSKSLCDEIISIKEKYILKDTKLSISQLSDLNILNYLVKSMPNISTISIYSTKIGKNEDQYLVHDNLKNFTLHSNYIGEIFVPNYPKFFEYENIRNNLKHLTLNDRKNQFFLYSFMFPNLISLCLFSISLFDIYKLPKITPKLENFDYAFDYYCEGITIDKQKRCIEVGCVVFSERDIIGILSNSLNELEKEILTTLDESKLKVKVKGMYLDLVSEVISLDVALPKLFRLFPNISVLKLKEYNFNISNSIEHTPLLNVKRLRLFHDHATDPKNTGGIALKYFATIAPNITFLELKKMQLNSNILSEFKNLETLLLENRAFQNQFTSIVNTPKLTDLKIDYNNLSSEDIKQIYENIPSLTCISFPCTLTKSKKLSKELSIRVEPYYSKKNDFDEE